MEKIASLKQKLGELTSPMWQLMENGDITKREIPNTSSPAPSQRALYRTCILTASSPAPSQRALHRTCIVIPPAPA